jgi:hypothetical protein
MGCKVSGIGVNVERQKGSLLGYRLGSECLRLPDRSGGVWSALQTIWGAP